MYHYLYLTIIVSFLTFLSTSFVTAPNFMKSHKKSGRVKIAYKEKEKGLQTLFEEKGIAYPPSKIYMRVFKSEDILELWALNDNTQTYEMIKKYGVCAMSGVLGPKRKQGDKQVPEGFYNIDLFNPYSAYHLSLHVDYPNKADRLRQPKSGNLGGDIYVHGQCKSIGCVSITNNFIKEIYILATEVRNKGQFPIPIHIFPARLSDLKYNILSKVYARKPSLLILWHSLKEGYDYFEETGKLPTINIDNHGHYEVGPSFDENT